MDINLIKIFVDVAEAGSFAAVARQQNTDPSRISRAISTLEKDLGLRLFHRTTRHLALSEAGEIYFNQVVSGLETLDAAREAAEAVTALPRGTLRLSVSHAWCHHHLLPHLSEFRQRYPDIRLQIHTSDHQESLASGGIDLAIRHAPSVESDYICRKLHPTRYRVVCSQEYLARIKTPEAPKELATLSLVQLTLGSAAPQWIFKKGEERLEVPVSAALSVSSPLTLSQVIRDGHGIGLLADWLVEADLQNGQLVSLFDTYDVTAESFETAAWIIYLDRTYMPLKVRAMIDFLTEKLG